MPRFKTTTLWQPDLVTSGRFLGTPVIPNIPEPWRTFTAAISSIEPSLKSAESDTESAYLAFNRLCMLSAIHQEFSGLRFHIPRDLKRTVKLYGSLYHGLLELCKQVHFISGGLDHPALLWLQICFEAEATMLLSKVDPAEDKPVKSLWLATERNRTASLRSLENPFHSPTTQLIFDLAIEASEHKYEQKWKRSHFDPLLSKRAAVLAEMRKSTKKNGVKLHPLKKGTCKTLT